jgi:SAM-dependent methyltransferase
VTVSVTSDASGPGALGDYISYLDFTGVAMAAPKKASIAALDLHPGDAVLDVGCGLGDDVRALAREVGPGGRAVGLDASPDLLAVATERSASAPHLAVQFVCADAHSMPFAAGEFAAARVERMLMYAADPQRVVAEMARVVRPGGRIVAQEPDWDTMAIASADLATSRAVVRACADRIRNPDAGRRLAEWFVLAGIQVVRVDTVAAPVQSLDVAEYAFDLDPALETLGAAVARPWLEELRRREAHGAFVATLTGFGIIGNAP